MVLKSKKSKSKRSTLRHKYKVIKKVKQHHQKKAKEEKKNLKAGRKPKAPKDPGIPAQWPFKTELLKDLEWQKQRILAQEKAKREEKNLKRVSTLWESLSCYTALVLGLVLPAAAVIKQCSDFNRQEILATATTSSFLQSYTEAFAYVHLIK